MTDARRLARSPWTPHELRSAVQDAEEAARRAGDVIGQHLTARAELKADGTLVTEADRRAEAVIRSALDERYAGVPVLGEEEGGFSGPLPGPHWIIDPLDDTSHFAIGSPVFGTLIGLLLDGYPELGVVYFPATGEMVSAATGQGCWYRHGRGGRSRLTVSSTRRLNEAFCSASGLHHSDLSAGDARPRYALRPIVAGARRFGIVGDCLQHVLVARGLIDAAIDTRMSPWDSAALIPCIREAGGHVATADGSPDAVFGGSLLSAGTPELLSEVITAMGGPSAT